MRGWPTPSLAIHTASRRDSAVCVGSTPSAAPRAGDGVPCSAGLALHETYRLRGKGVHQPSSRPVAPAPACRAASWPDLVRSESSAPRARTDCGSPTRGTARRGLVCMPRSSRHVFSRWRWAGRSPATARTGAIHADALDMAQLRRKPAGTVVRSGLRHAINIPPAVRSTDCASRPTGSMRRRSPTPAQVAVTRDDRARSAIACD